MTAENSCGASLADLTANGSLYSVSLCGSGNDAEKMISREESGAGEGDRHLRNVIDSCEASVVYLLLTADLVKLYGLDLLLIVEISNGRIVERDMSVLTDTHNDDVGGVLFKEL